MKKSGETDCRVMAIPDNMCKPFVNAVYEGCKVLRRSL